MSSNRTTKFATKKGQPFRNRAAGTYPLALSARYKTDIAALTGVDHTKLRQQLLTKPGSGDGDKRLVCMFYLSARSPGSSSGEGRYENGRGE